MARPIPDIPRARETSSLAAFLAGGGGMRGRIRDFDWASTPLGPIETWPRSLATAVRIMLTSRYAMWMAWGPDLTFFCNDAYLPTVGIKRDWVLGARSDKVWEEIWPDIGPRIERVLTTGEATWDESLLLFLERSGFPEETYHTFSYSPLADDEGVIAGMLCVVTEVTEREVGERRLATLRDLGARLAGARRRGEVVAAVDGCLAADARDLPFALTYLLDEADGVARLASREGMDAAHPLAMEWINPSDPTAFWPIGAALASGAPVEVDLSAVDPRPPSGPWRESPRSALVVPIVQQGQSRPVGVFIGGLNPFRPLDAGYRGFIDLFVGQIAGGFAGAQSYEQERRRAEALAEIDRAKTLFFSNISHEFRTPLTLMLGPLEDVLAKANGEAWRPELELVHRNGLRLLRLVNALLDFSRVEAGRMQANFEPVDLARLTEDLASNFRSATDKAGLDLAIASAPGLDPVHVDRDMWEKVVLNLLSNAFKFTFDGSIKIDIRPSLDGARAEVTVRDTGIGIPAEDLPHLFERFRRVEGVRGRSIEGSGIGLALVQELVKLHGGAIRVESKPGRGSAFTVSLPFGSKHLPGERIAQARTQASTKARSQAFVDEALGWLSPGADATPPSHEAGAEAKTVVLADDNPDMRAYAERLLRAAGYRVESYGDGEAALDGIRRAPPDLVLSDVMMPKLDGFGLLAALRADPELRDIPVLLLSARAGDEAKVEGINAGADDYLTKPFSARELLARVEVNLRLAQIRREASRLLKEQVAERTAELSAANERLRAEAVERGRAEFALRQVQKMESIGQLTGGVAHDFNNLLTIIIGNLESLRRRLRDPESNAAAAERYAENAMRGAQRAASLTQRLLAFSRQQPLDPKPVDINRLVGGMSDLLRRTLGEQVAIESVLAGGLWPVHVDPNQLEVAILNLAVNGRDAMHDGGKLTIETANAHLDEAYAASQTEVAPGQYVVVAVSDDGVGMDKDTVMRAFEPFFTTKEIGQGTGLGLSQVYGFVKQSGGHVKIYSELGGGTTVKIYLPRTHALAREPDIEPFAAAPDAMRGETVLVVEDDEDVRAHSAGILRELGYFVIEAVNAHAGLRALEQHPEIKVLFTDVGLPGGMNGRQLADEARRRRPGLKILFTTGYARNAIVHEGRLEAGVQLITKPFTYAGLAQKLRSVMDAGEPVRRILVVEDEVLLQMMVVETLEEAGFEAQTAGTAADALNRLRFSPDGFAGAIVDIGLPDRKGDALVAELRALYPTLPIVIASGQDAAMLRKHFAADPLIAVVGKPHTNDQLYAALRSVGLHGTKPPAA